MTLFQKVLKELILIQLYKLINDLQNEIDSYDSDYIGYDKQLSMIQQDLLMELSSKTQELKDQTDEEYKEALKALIEHTISKITEARNEHQITTKGKTLSALEAIPRQIDKLYKKLDEINGKFKTLNEKYMENPEIFMYYHTVKYLLNGVLKIPKNLDIKTKKEEALINNMIALKKELSLTPNPLDKVKSCQRCIVNILNTNKQIVQLEKDKDSASLTTVALSAMSIFAKIPVPEALKNCFSFSTGRLALEFKYASYKITCWEKNITNSQAEMKLSN